MISVLQLADIKRTQEQVVGNQVAFNTFHCSPLLNSEGFPRGHALRSHAPGANASASPQTSAAPCVFPIFFRCVPATPSLLSMPSDLHPTHLLGAPRSENLAGSTPAAASWTHVDATSVQRVSSQAQPSDHFARRQR
jgi:hypothetical protein